MSGQYTSTTQRAAAVVGGAFGLAGMVAGTRVLSGIDVPDYHVLPWLVVYNVVTSTVAVVVAIGLWRGRRWAAHAAMGLAGATGSGEIGQWKGANEFTRIPQDGLCDLAIALP